MQIRIFTSGLQGILLTLVYVALLFTTLPYTPYYAGRLSSMGYLEEAVAGMFIVSSLVVARGAVRSGRLKYPSFWVTIVLLVMIYIFTESVTQTYAEPLHLLTYGILVFLIFSAARFRLGGAQLFILSVSLTAGIGVLDEIIQYCLPGRHFGWNDVVINGLGGIAGLMIVRFIFGDTGKRCGC
ncbi:MAG: hypothetical protein IEMM0002_0343 [bacterium]|nr:MAG: hypothetical protein IEMM0002_0343 [bacterium]